MCQQPRRAVTCLFDCEQDKGRVCGCWLMLPKGVTTRRKLLFVCSVFFCLLASGLRLALEIMSLISTVNCTFERFNDIL